MKKVNLQAKIRTILGRKTNQLRAKNQIPAVLYGQNIKNQNLDLSSKDLQHALKLHGANALIDLKIDDQKPILTFLQNIQRHPVSDQIIHCDFWKINPDQEIKTQVIIKPQGTSLAIEEMGGSLLQNKPQIEISALPDKLISELEVDITPLKTFEDRILIKDLNLPRGIKVLDDPEELVLAVQEPRSEEEMEELEEKPVEDVEAVAVEEKGKEEEKTETEAEAETQGKKQEKPDEQESAKPEQPAKK